jgi:hypothetical protein
LPALRTGRGFTHVVMRRGRERRRGAWTSGHGQEAPPWGAMTWGMGCQGSCALGLSGARARPLGRLCWEERLGRRPGKVEKEKKS